MVIFTTFHYLGTVRILRTLETVGDLKLDRLLIYLIWAGIFHCRHGHKGGSYVQCEVLKTTQNIWMVLPVRIHDSQTPCLHKSTLDEVSVIAYKTWIIKVLIKKCSKSAEKIRYPFVCSKPCASLITQLCLNTDKSAYVSYIEISKYFKSFLRYN